MKASGPRALRSFCRVFRLFNQETDHAARKHMLQDRLPRPTNKKVAVYCISYQEIDTVERRINKQASRDDFKIPKPCTGSPLRRLQVKLSVCKALSLPRSDGTDPAHATDALDKKYQAWFEKLSVKEQRSSASRANTMPRLPICPPCVIRKLL